MCLVDCFVRAIDSSANKRSNTGRRDDIAEIIRMDDRESASQNEQGNGVFGQKG